MIKPIISASLILCGALALSACASSPAPGVNGLYNFQYHVAKWEGSSAVKPVQVFDDGAETYFQLKPGEPTPALFTADRGVMRPVSARRDGYYVVAPGVANVWRVVGSSGHGVVRGSPGSHSHAPKFISSKTDPSATSPASGSASDPVANSGEQSQKIDNSALPATLNGDIQSLLKQVNRLQKEIAVEKAHAYIHPAETTPMRSFSLVVPFAEGDSSLNQARASELARIASLAKAATRVDVKEVSTPGGARKANLALAHKRVEVVRKALVSMGVVKSAIHVLRPKLDGEYPHVSVRFSVPNLQAISGKD